MKRGKLLAFNNIQYNTFINNRTVKTRKLIATPPGLLINDKMRRIAVNGTKERGKGGGGVFHGKIMFACS